MRLSVWIITCFLSTGVWGQNLQQQLVEQLQAALPAAHIGVLLIQDQKVLAEYQADHLFVPASTTKLLTAAAALLDLGEHYRYQTTLSYQSQPQLARNVHLHFSGDPSLTSHDLAALISQLAKRGVKRIDGNITLEHATFKRPYLPLNSDQDTQYWYYQAPVSTIIIDGNKVDAKIKTDNFHHLHHKVLLGHGVTFYDQIKVVDAEFANSLCAVDLDENQHNEIFMRGCWPAFKYPRTLHFAIKNPELYARHIIVEALKKSSIEWNGHFVNGANAAKAQVQLKHFSKPLSALMTTMLKESDNIMAGALTKTLGAKHYHYGSFQAGAQAIIDILSKQLSLSPQQFHLVDGAGYSHVDLITPRALVQVLTALQTNATWRHALPLYAKDGTLADRHYQPSLTKHLIAKTGSMKFTSALAGYLQQAGQSDIIFSIMINNAPYPQKQLKAAEDHLLASTLTYLRS